MKRTVSIESKAGLTFEDLAEFVDAGRESGMVSDAPVQARVTMRGRLRQLAVDVLCVPPGARASAEDVRR